MKLRSTFLYLLLILVVAAATVGVMLLLQNINERQAEAKQDIFRVVEINNDTLDPAEWGKNYPRQYDSYKRTVDTERTRHGGSEAFQHLDEDPIWKVIFAGYAFGVDYREDRGHAYMLSDQDITERVHIVKQPGSCLHCHSSATAAYRNAGIEAGAPAGEEHFFEQMLTGFPIVSSMPYTEARTLVEHPIGCIDCHDPDNMQLRVSRPAFLYGIQELAKSDAPTPHLPSIERWRTGDKSVAYDPNTDATRQEMRSYVCAQCHVEYYFATEKKIVTYPWSQGLKVEDEEAYYDEIAFKDWTHKQSGASMLKAQHPEFELWSQGVHAASGVACADCHMPYQREGAIKVSDHHVRSPLLNVDNSCLTCHNFSEEEMKARAETIQDRTKDLLDRAEVAVAALISDLEKAIATGVPEEQLKPAQDLQRKAQWRLDFISAENSMGFHAPQESARILGEAIDYARQGQLELAKVASQVAMNK